MFFGCNIFSYTSTPAPLLKLALFELLCLFCVCFCFCEGGHELPHQDEKENGDGAEDEDGDEASVSAFCVYALCLHVCQMGR